MFYRCCQNGLVSVWTVPQDVSNYPESSSSESEGWWENEAKPKFVVHHITVEGAGLMSCILLSCFFFFNRPQRLLLSHAVTVFQPSQWSGDGAACVFQLKGHITPVRTLAFSPDGLALASGGVGGLMNIWSLRVRAGCEAPPIQQTKHRESHDSRPAPPPLCYRTARCSRLL